MNILHIVDMISQERAGGSAKVPYQLGEIQVRMGHKVTIYSSDYNAENQQPPKGVELVIFKVVTTLMGVKITPDMWYADFSKFDIIHLHNYRTFVNIVAASKGIPCVLQAHGSAAPMQARLTKPIHNYLWRNRIMSRCSAFIADAEMEIGQYMTEGAPRGSIFNIPVGIDFREFSKLPSRQVGQKRMVLFLVRFHKNKGPDLLLKAVKILNRKDTFFVMAGYDDGCEEAIEQQADDMGIRSKVKFVGPLYGKDKVAAYNSADVYVMPSRRELFGLTLLEALASGTPVIITDVCGVAPLLPKECGMVVPFDEHALAQAINYALDNDSASSYRGYRVKWAKQYDWMNIAPRIMEVYERMLSK